LTWIAVAIASAVSVFVIDWTTTGRPPPMCTVRSFQATSTARVASRAAGPASIPGSVVPC